MKRIFTFFIVAIAIFTLASCQNNTETTDPIIPVTDVHNNTHILEAEQLCKPAEAIEQFRADPYAEVKGYRLWDTGHVWSAETCNTVGNIHYDESPKGYSLLSTIDQSVWLKDGILTFFNLTNTEQVTVSNAKYCGYSYWYGFVFRDGNTVFSIDLEKQRHELASGVAMVIDADYAATSDAWSQPLFLMQDGTVQTVIGWGDEGYLIPVSATEHGYDENTFKFTGVDEGGWYYN